MITSYVVVVTKNIIFLIVVTINKELEPYKHKERRINGSLEPPAKAVLTMRMESPDLLEN